MATEASKLDDYFRVAFQQKLMVRMPEKEEDHLTPATRLLEKRREMVEVEQALSAQKEEFQMKMESLQQRREELERKEYQLKESLLKFDKFLKENDSKRARAIKKASDEKDLRTQKDREIVKLEEEMQSYDAERERMKEKLNRSERYQQFMDAVIERAEDYQEIREIIARYDTLTSTKTELADRERTSQLEIDRLRKKLDTYIEAKNNELLHCGNLLADLQSKLDDSHSRSLEWEAKWQHIKNTASTKTLMVGKIKMSIHNLYNLLLRSLKYAEKETPVPSEDTFEQLEKIRQYMSDLFEISETVRLGIVKSTIGFGGTLGGSI